MNRRLSAISALIHSILILEKEAIAFKAALVDQVKSEEIIVVCDGVDERVLPNLSNSVPKVNFAPVGPHPCGSYEVSRNFLHVILLGYEQNSSSELHYRCLPCRFGAPANPWHRCSPLQS